MGLRAGRVVFDGTPDQLTHDALTAIYGEEDWNEMRRGDEEQTRAEADARRPIGGNWRDDDAIVSYHLAPPAADLQGIGGGASPC